MPEFQHKALKALHSLAKKGQASPRAYATLYDSVMTNEGKKQRWGTQGKCTKSGAWKPMPIEDPAHLTERRQKIGFKPPSESYYAKLVEKALCSKMKNLR